MKAYNIIENLEKWIKKDLIDTWDNTGYQVGSLNKDVKNILIALDLDREILDLAISKNIDMIITHHPFIFSKLDRVISEDYKGNMLIDIIKNDILVYNCHSNLDLANGGVNDILAKVLNLSNIKYLNNTFELDSYTYGYGRIGNIERKEACDFLEEVKSNLNVENLLVYGNLNKKIENIAVCGGSGSSFIQDAYNSGADMYITGDIKYHDGQKAAELDMIIVDAGHYHTEKVILDVLKEYILKNIDEKLNIEVITKSTLPFIVY